MKKFDCGFGAEQSVVKDGISEDINTLLQMLVETDNLIPSLTDSPSKNLVIGLRAASREFYKNYIGQNVTKYLSDPASFSEKEKSEFAKNLKEAMKKEAWALDSARTVYDVQIKKGNGYSSVVKSGFGIIAGLAALSFAWGMFKKRGV